MPSDSITDAEYVQKLQHGQTDAFEALIRRHEKTIFNLVYRMLGDYDEAAEIAKGCPALKLGSVVEVRMALPTPTV